MLSTDMGGVTGKQCERLTKECSNPCPLHLHKETGKNVRSLSSNSFWFEGYAGGREWRDNKQLCPVSGASLKKACTPSCLERLSPSRAWRGRGVEGQPLMKTLFFIKFQQGSSKPSSPPAFDFGLLGPSLMNLVFTGISLGRIPHFWYMIKFFIPHS